MPKKSVEEQQVLANITHVTKHLETLTPGSTDYKDTLSNLTTLTTILAEMRGKKTGLEPWIPLFAHLGGIGLITAFEAGGHVVLSKALTLTSPFRK